MQRSWSKINFKGCDLFKDSFQAGSFKEFHWSRARQARCELNLTEIEGSQVRNRL